MMVVNGVVHRPAELAFDDLGAGVGRHVHHGDGFTQIRVRLEAGALLPEHEHVHEQYTVVVAGRLRYRICRGRPDEYVVEIGPGDGIWLPSLLPHEALALEPTDTVEIFVPRRADLEASPVDGSLR